MFLRIYAWILGFAFLIDIVFWTGAFLIVRKKVATRRAAKQADISARRTSSQDYPPPA